METRYETGLRFLSEMVEDVARRNSVRSESVSKENGEIIVSVAREALNIVVEKDPAPSLTELAAEAKSIAVDGGNECSEKEQAHYCATKSFTMQYFLNNPGSHDVSAHRASSDHMAELILGLLHLASIKGIDIEAAVIKSMADARAGLEGAK